MNSENLMEAVQSADRESRAAYQGKRLRIFAAVAVAIAVTGIFVALDFFADDAFITFRYAWNLANGHSLVWNPGEPPVEGYTNFLWLLLMTAAHLLGVSPVAASRVLGVAALAATTTLVFVWVRDRTHDLSAASTGALFLLAFPPSYLHAVSGMETTAYGFLLLLLAYEVLGRPHGAGWMTDSLVPLLVLAIGLTRPEGLIVGAAGLVLHLRNTPARARKRALLCTIVWLVLPGGLYFGWRVWFFDALLPSTFYVKAAGWLPGLRWAGSTFLALVPVWVLGVLALGFARLDRSGAARDLRALFLLVAAALVPYTWFNLMMDYAMRFAAHAFPLCAAAVGLSLAIVKTALRGTAFSRGHWSAISLLVMTTQAVQGISVLNVPLLLSGYHMQHGGIALAARLQTSDLDPPLRSIALGDVGVLGYYSRWSVIDIIGLNDAAIAHGMSPTRRVREAKPTLLIVYSEDGLAPRPHQYGLEVDELLPDYEFAGAIQVSTNYYWLVWTRLDLPLSARSNLTTAVREVAAHSRDHNGQSGFWMWLGHVWTRLRRTLA